MKRKLTMHIPDEIRHAIVRRHRGSDLSIEKLAFAITSMKELWESYSSVKEKLDWLLDVYWEEKKIEKHFGEPVFYGAHRRLQNLRKKQEDLHRQMFYLLLNADGNYEPFSLTGSLSAEEVYGDFMAKYEYRDILKL